MEHRKLARYLMIAGGLAGIGGGFIFLVELPALVQYGVQAYPSLAGYACPGLIYIGCMGLLCAAAMGEYFFICYRIGQNHSFCRENAAGLSRIGWELAGVAALCLGGIGASLLPGMQAGAWCWGLVLAAMASGALGMLAWALGKLLGQAVQLQEESDLTV